MIIVSGINLRSNFCLTSVLMTIEGLETKNVKSVDDSSFKDGVSIAFGLT